MKHFKCIRNKKNGGIGLSVNLVPKWFIFFADAANVCLENTLVLQQKQAHGSPRDYEELLKPARN